MWSWQRPRRVVAPLVVAVAVAAGGAPAAHAQGCANENVKPTAVNRAQVAAATLCLVNAERARNGLGALRGSGQLRRAATFHSNDMVAHRYFEHDSPGGASTILTRARDAGYLRKVRSFHLLENLAWGSGRLSTPKATMAAWRASPVHEANILSPAVKQAGIGIALGAPQGGPGATYTMAFGSRRR